MVSNRLHSVALLYSGWGFVWSLVSAARLLMDFGNRMYWIWYTFGIPTPMKLSRPTDRWPTAGRGVCCCLFGGVAILFTKLTFFLPRTNCSHSAALGLGDGTLKMTYESESWRRRADDPSYFDSAPLVDNRNHTFGSAFGEGRIDAPRCCVMEADLHLLHPHKHTYTWWPKIKQLSCKEVGCGSAPVKCLGHVPMCVELF